MVPNAVTDEMYADHWSEEEVVEILGALCMFGVFNRCNDSMASLEDPIVSAGALIGDKG